MRSVPRTVAVLTLGVLYVSPARGEVSKEVYARAEQMLEWNANQRVFHAPVDPRWIDENRFWYRKRIGLGHEFIYVDPTTGVRRPAFDHQRLAASLSSASGVSCEPYALPFEEFVLVDDDTTLEFWEKAKKKANQEGEKAPNRRWRCDLRTYQCAGPEDVAPRRKDEVESPDGKWRAFSREMNLWIRAVASGEEIQLSRDGEEHFGYAVAGEGCCYTITDRREENRTRAPLFWSPDSRKIATYRLDERNVLSMPLIETKEGRPILHAYRYALPGDSVVPLYKVHVFDVDARSQLEIRTDPMERHWRENDGFEVRWSADGRSIYFVHLARGHQSAALHVADAATGEARLVLEEKSRTFLDLTGRPHPREEHDVQDWRVSRDGKDVLWHSERDGFGHFYRFDAATGTLRNPVTSGPWFAEGIHQLDEANGFLTFVGYGREKGIDPYSAQLYRARLDGSSIERLTREDASHQIESSPSGRYFVDSYSTWDKAPVTVVRGTDGRILLTLEQADASELFATGWTPGEPFTVKARDGVTDLHGLLYRPSSFDPDRKYPVIDNIYPGPQIGPIRRRGFDAGPGGFARALAELGFLVVQIDALGTPFRSKAFHDVWYGDMGDNGIIDHIGAIKQLAARHPQIDLDRVGIYGHSGGGFSSTGAILRYPDFFKVAVSGAGNHDNRSYAWSWGEKYQGLLATNGEDDNYESQANHLLAGNLKGHLLLTYGTLDDNVHPNATLLLVNALIEHNKDFDMLVFPNRNHRYAREPYVIRKTWDYFVRHLAGEEPPTGYEIQDPP
jgi:dipeptidyl aminopeptidase/acylaminoacyl peptidase